MQYIGVDIETTGLDEKQGVIVQVGMVLINDYTVQDVFDVTLATQPRDWAKAHETVVRMHTASGLLSESLASSIDCKEAEEQLKAWVAGTGVQRPHMMGSSIHFDRRWLQRHMPSLCKGFHYQMIDATSSMLAWEIRNGTEFPPREDAAHTAIEDILASLELLEACS